ncbi:hypothetical protein [Caldimonas sp. KR1-144]|uniref:hypothetical protein n=1 Tax=Caldimonas sp. KR1-144 TaxID=3400911 RepID=UPI003BFD5397
MKIISLLLSLLYLAVAFVFVGATIGSVLWLMAVPIFGVNFASLPLFAAGGATPCVLWAFSRVFTNDAGAATATPPERNWMVADSIETLPSLVDQPLGQDNAATFGADVDASAWAAQPRCMIDAFTLGDNLYETVYGA